MWNSFSQVKLKVIGEWSDVKGIKKPTQKLTFSGKPLKLNITRGDEPLPVSPRTLPIGSSHVHFLQSTAALRGSSPYNPQQGCGPRHWEDYYSRTQSDQPISLRPKIGHSYHLLPPVLHSWVNFPTPGCNKQGSPSGLLLTFVDILSAYWFNFCCSKLRNL